MIDAHSDDYGSSSSCEEGEFDEEEERLRGVAASRQRRQQVQSEKLRTRHILRDYRAKKEMEEQVKRQNREAHQRAGACHSESSRSHAQDFSFQEERHEWVLHEQRWTAIEAQSNSSQTVFLKDIPWPPCTEGILLGMLRGASDRPLGMLPDLKREFRKASRRWHPDKFLARFKVALDTLDSQALETVMVRVNEISQQVNSEWTTAQSSQDSDP